MVMRPASAAKSVNAPVKMKDTTAFFIGFILLNILTSYNNADFSAAFFSYPYRPFGDRNRPPLQHWRCPDSGTARTV